MFVIPDKNEEKSAQELQTRLGWRCQPLYLSYPDGTKDLNDVHVRYGIDTVSQLIKDAKRRYSYGH
jgi:hypothetical protein